MGRSSARNRRSDAIAALIATAGSVRLRDLVKELGVSEMTLRRDAQFPDAGFACLGGYVVSASAGGAGAYDFDHALRRQVDAKRAAARQVLALLRPGMRVFVDCGSTTTHLASLLTADAGIAVITHSLPVAELLVRRDNVPVELLGGPARPETRSMHPDPAVLPPGIDLAVMTASGLAGGQARCAFAHEIGVKRAVLSAAARVVLLADASKLDQGGGHGFAALSRFEAVATELGLVAPTTLPAGRNS